MNVLKAILIAYFVLSALIGIGRVIASAGTAKRPSVGAAVTGTAIGLALHAGLILAVVYA